MWHRTLIVAVVLGWSAPAWAQDEPAAKQAADKPAIERVKENPNDTQALTAYANEAFPEISRLVQADPKQALQKIEELEAFIGDLKAEEPAAKTLVSRIKSSATYLRSQAELAQVSVADLEKQLDESPNDAKAIQQYSQKLMQEIGMMARSQPLEAEAKLEAAKEKLAKISDAATEASAKQAVETAVRSLARLAPTIQSGKKLAELVGKDAAPLKVEAWVNGEPLTDEALKGKVVLLDFWAMWCGPCIATFPHLREWNEKYADKGLVMIGLTRYYNMRWNEDTKRAVRLPATEMVPPAEEQEALDNFAAHHGLTHRFATQEGDELSKYYAVTGIPHVVLIDQQGKVRLVRVGSGEANAKDIEAMLEKLLAAE